MQIRIPSLSMVAVVMLVASPAAALDCGAVVKLSAQGKNPREVAMALSLTTPQVEECLADPAEPAIRREREELDGAIAPETALDGAVPDSAPLLDQE